MSSFSCPICEYTFDETARVPRMVDCGHTLCTPCLEKMISEAKDDRLFCPEDQEQLENFRPEKGVTSFPVNKVLLKRKTIKKKPSPLSKDASTRISNLSSLNLCAKHNKPREIVCQTEAIVICPDCACTPEHKNHDLLNNENFIMFLKQMTVHVRDEISKLGDQPFFADGEDQLKKLEEALVHRKNELFAELTSVFDELQGMLFQRQKDLTTELEKHLLATSEAIGQLRANVSQWDERRKSLDKNIGAADNFVLHIDLDYNTVLESCCKQPNLEANLKELVEETKLFEVTAKERIMASLGAIKVVKGEGDLMAFLTAKIGVVREVLEIEKPKPTQADAAQPEHSHAIGDNKSIDQPGSTKVLGNKNSAMTPNKSTSFLNQKHKRHMAKPSGHELSSFDPQPSVPKNSVLNPINNGFQVQTDATDKATKNDADLMNISADDLNMSVSAMGSGSQSGQKLGDKSILDEEIDYSDLSVLDASQSDKNNKPKRTLMTRKLANNSFIKTREDSPNHPKSMRSKGENVLSDKAGQKDETSLRPNMMHNVSKKMINSKSNNEILGAMVEARLKRHNLDMKANPSANNFFIVPGEIPGAGLRSLAPVPSGLKSPIDRIEERETNLLSPTFELDSTPRLPLNTKSFLEKDQPPSSREQMLIGRPNTLPVINEKLSMPLPKRTETTSIGNIPGNTLGNSSALQTLKAKIPVKLGSIDDNTTEINLTGKRINDSTLSIHFSDIMKQKKAKILNLSGNFITEVGVGLLLKNLGGHPSLEKIILRENYVGENIFSVLKSSAPLAKKIRQFDILENQERIDRTKLKTEVANLRKFNIILDINSK